MVDSRLDRLDPAAEGPRSTLPWSTGPDNHCPLRGQSRRVETMPKSLGVGKAGGVGAHRDRDGFRVNDHKFNREPPANQP
jgi:hypothetical protein